MSKISHVSYRLVLLLAAAVAANPVLAEKPSRGGGGKHSPHKERKEHGDRHGEQGRGSGDQDGGRDYEDRSYHGEHGGDSHHEPYFNDQHRTIMRDYYVQQYHTGHCPPGLAKKHNGCLPPGQAKKWQIGRPLPRDVVYYDVPAGMLGYPPPGYRLVRVASDILMIAVGTGMVVDAMTDLGAW